MRLSDLIGDNTNFELEVHVDDPWGTPIGKIYFDEGLGGFVFTPEPTSSMSLGVDDLKALYRLTAFLGK